MDLPVALTGRPGCCAGGALRAAGRSMFDVGPLGAGVAGRAIEGVGAVGAGADRSAAGSSGRAGGGGTPTPGVERTTRRSGSGSSAGSGAGADAGSGASILLVLVLTAGAGPRAGGGGMGARSGSGATTTGAGSGSGSGSGSRFSPRESARRLTRSADGSSMLDEWLLTPILSSLESSTTTWLSMPSSRASS
jgi:hypothetical protein